MNFIASLDDIISAYDVILCDVWGVIHNGEQAFKKATNALLRTRDAGKYVILLTNSPRSNTGVAQQLQTFGITTRHYDVIVTSGDATHALICALPAQIFHIGAKTDLSIYENTHKELVSEQEAKSIVCTGFFNDETEVPHDYITLLQRLRARDLPFICANPDILVERGNRLIYCAGALAHEYEKMGGLIRVAGKPHAPIYELALQKNPKPTSKSKVLAIGDGLLTDVKGANNNGFDLLYISSGVHAREYGTHSTPDRPQLETWLQTHAVSVNATMPYLA
jgi:HAD superfamily hydrolase (TIGR01459 family)